MTPGFGRSNAGSLVIATMLIVVGVVVLIDTAGYADMDSKIFPRAAAVMLILSAAASAALTLTRPVRVEGWGAGDWWRRGLLVGSMLAAALLMPAIGFLTASVIVFAGGLVAGMHGRWGRREAVLYPLFAAVIAGGFYALFKYALYVPLP